MDVVKALFDKYRLADIFTRAREILHEGEDGCKKACYECLLNYFNQSEHSLLDRNLALHFLNKYRTINIKYEINEDKLRELEEGYDSGFEKNVLHKIIELNLPLPDKGKKIIYDKKGVPIAETDFFYEPNIIVFVHGDPHKMDHIKKADEKKLLKLKALGYTIVSITDIKDVDELKEILIKSTL